MIPAFYIAIVVSIAGLIAATYTDLKERIVPNKLNYGLAAAGLLIFGAQSIIEGSYYPFIYSILGLCFGFIFGWILWKLGVFAGGDVKLFMGLGALNPFTPALIKAGLLTSANLPLFPITIFIYSLISFLPYGVFVVAYRVSKNKKFQKELYAEMKPRVILAVHGSIFASGAFVIAAQYAVNSLWLIPLLFVWGFFGKNKKFITAIAVLLALYFNPLLFAQAIAAAMVFSVGAYTLVKLMFSTRKVLSTEMEVKKLEEGMIPARSLAWKGKKVVEIAPFEAKQIFKYLKEKDIGGIRALLAPQKEIISSRKARGLSEEELKEVKKLAAKGLMPKKIWVKESMPFVPTMLLGYLLCLVLGDFVLLIVMGAL